MIDIDDWLHENDYESVDDKTYDAIEDAFDEAQSETKSEYAERDMLEAIGMIRAKGIKLHKKSKKSD